MPEALPEISLGTAAIAIFLICAFYVVVRGMVRMMVGTLVIAASAWLGFRAWQLAPEFALEWTGGLPPALIYGIPVGVFILAFLVLRLILKTISRPFAERNDEFREDRFSMRRMLFRLPLLLIPTALLCVIGAVIVHHLGAMEEIRLAAGQAPDSEAADTTEATGESTYLARLKASITRAIPESWLSWLDPLTEPNRLSLAKLIAAQESGTADGSHLEPVTDPETGRPIPRAIIVEDPDLQTLARDRSYGTLLRHPHLDQALKDPEVRRWIELLQP